MKYFALLFVVLAIRAEVLPLQNASFDSALEPAWKSEGKVSATNGSAVLNAAKNTFIRQAVTPMMQPLTTYSAFASVGLNASALLTNGASLFLSLQACDEDEKLLRTLGIK